MTTTVLIGKGNLSTRVVRALRSEGFDAINSCDDNCTCRRTRVCDGRHDRFWVDAQNRGFPFDREARAEVKIIIARHATKKDAPIVARME